MNVSDAQKAAEPQLLMKVNAMSTCQKELLMNHELEAQRMAASSFELLVEKSTAKQIAEDLRNSEFGKVKGTGGEEGRYCFISYQSKLAGESTSLPHLRPPSLRNAASLPGGAHLKKWFRQCCSHGRQEAQILQKFIPVIALSWAMPANMETMRLFLRRLWIQMVQRLCGLRRHCMQTMTKKTFVLGSPTS